MAIWLIRAGKHGERENYALDNGCAVIGWSECKSFSGLSKREELLPLLENTYPDCGHKRLLNWESQLWPFINTIQIGDIVALPLKTVPVSLWAKSWGVTDTTETRRLMQIINAPLNGLKKFPDLK